MISCQTEMIAESYKGNCQSLVVGQNNFGDRRFRHDSPEAGRTNTDNLLRIDLGRECGQSGSERIREDRLSERDEEGGAEILSNADESGADGHLVFRHVSLDGRDRLLQNHATGKAIKELIAHSGGAGGGGCEGTHKTRSHGCHSAPNDDEWSVIADF